MNLAQPSDAIFDRYMKIEELVGPASVDVEFLPDGSGVSFRDPDPKSGLIHRVDAETGLRQTGPVPEQPPVELCIPDAMAAQVDARFGILPQSRCTPRTFEREVLMVGQVPALEVASPDGTWLASVKDGNLWLRATIDGLARSLTVDGSSDDAWDIEPGLRSPWSPDSLRLFAIRFDRRSVPKLPILHVLKPEADVSWHRMQKAGAAIDRAALFIVPVLGKAPVPIDVGDTTDHYFRLLGWRADGKEVFFARFMRDFHCVEVLAADAFTGTVRSVLHESGATCVRMQHEVLWGGDVGFTWLPENQGFLWLSERDGWKHLYRYGSDGRLPAQLTSGEWVVHGVAAVDEVGGWVYCRASVAPRLYDVHLCRMPLAGGEPEWLTEGQGQHQAQLSPCRQFFVDTWSSPATPPRMELRRSNGRFVALLHEADLGRLRASGWRPPEEFTVKAADGQTELFGLLYLPDDFDASRRYAVVEYIYGGPQIHNLPTSFLGGRDGSGARVEHFVQALAKTGCAVFVLAGRGTPGRSKAFQDVTYKNWAGPVVADHAGALQQLLAARPYLDASRVGVFGRSWGGYFSFRLLADRPEVYKTAVSIVPGFDPYAGILYEPFLGLPDRDREPYEEASAFRLASKVKGNLLLVGGLRDIGTYADVLRMSAALVDAQVHHELLLVPNQPHYFVGPAADFADREVLRFLRRNLGMPT